MRLYRNKSSEEFISTLSRKFGDFFLIPEGGTNQLAVLGTGEILNESTKTYDFIATAAGTGGTAAGLIKSANSEQHILVFPVLKDNSLKGTIEELSQQPNGSNWSYQENYHFGGYAKWNVALIDFINQFKIKHDIPLDPIYTGKMMFGLFDLVQKNFFPDGTKILSIHTGGLQGIRGFNNRYGHLLK